MQTVHIKIHSTTSTKILHWAKGTYHKKRSCSLMPFAKRDGRSRRRSTPSSQSKCWQTTCQNKPALNGSANYKVIEWFRKLLISMSDLILPHTIEKLCVYGDLTVNRTFKKHHITLQPLSHYKLSFSDNLFWKLIYAGTAPDYFWLIMAIAMLCSAWQEIRHLIICDHLWPKQSHTLCTTDKAQVLCLETNN